MRVRKTVLVEKGRLIVFCTHANSFVSKKLDH